MIYQHRFTNSVNKNEQMYVMMLSGVGIRIIRKEQIMLFYEHDFIKTIANQKAWTISDNKKIPIHMGKLMLESRTVGANPYDITSFVNLYELYHFYLTKFNAYPPNHAFYLDAIEHGFCVLDIEPKCPENIKQQLLQLPYRYGEISLSGKGYHLVFDLPIEILKEYPIVYQKVAMKEEHGYYEILLNHFCTFTGKLIPPSNPSTLNGFNGFKELFQTLAMEQKDTRGSDVDVQEIEGVNTKMTDQILILLHTASKQYHKTLADFHDDHSTYEFAFIAFLNYKLNLILKVQAIQNENHVYSDSEKAWFLWQTAMNDLPFRAKHREKRDHLPWLLYVAKKVISLSTTEDNANEK